MGRKLLKVSPTELNLTPAHPDHAYALAPHLREADKREIDAYYPDIDHGIVLEDGVNSSDQCFTICTGDTIHGLWGHGVWGTGGPVPGDLGYIWMMTDDQVFTTHAIQITRVARKQIFPQLDNLYAAYGNWVHSANLVHIRWLLGAGFKQTSQSSINGQPFSLYLRCATL